MVIIIYLEILLLLIETDQTLPGWGVIGLDPSCGQIGFSSFLSPIQAIQTTAKEDIAIRPAC